MTVLELSNEHCEITISCSEVPSQDWGIVGCRLRGGTGTEYGWRGKVEKNGDGWMDRIIICNRVAKDGTYAVAEMLYCAVLCCKVFNVG